MNDVLRRSEERRRLLLARRSRDCLDHNLRFQPVRIGGLKWWVRREAFDEKLRAILRDPDGALARCSHMFKSGPNRVSTIGAFDGLVLKRFNVKNRWNYVKDLFRKSRAFRAYRHAYHLELLGLPTPRPLAAAERRVLRVLMNGYLITEEIPGAVDLGGHLEKENRLDPELIRKVADLMAHLHKEGISQQDLKAQNIVLDTKRDLYLVDTDAVLYLRQVTSSQGAADLERLARGIAKHVTISRLDRMKFLHRYCKTRGIMKIPELQPRR